MTPEETENQKVLSFILFYMFMNPYKEEVVQGYLQRQRGGGRGGGVRVAVGKRHGMIFLVQAV